MLHEILCHPKEFLSVALKYFLRLLLLKNSGSNIQIYKQKETKKTKERKASDFEISCKMMVEFICASTAPSKGVWCVIM